MPSLSTKLHGICDYAGGLALLVARARLTGDDARVRGLLRATGAATLLTSVLTDYELGLRRLIPMRVHLALDAGSGAMLVGAGIALPRLGTGTGVLLRLAALGGGELALAALSEREPGDRPRAEAPEAPDTPGDSVTAPELSGSNVEGAERVEARSDGSGEAPIDDVLVAREEAAAASEAARIGGGVRAETGNPAMDPVYEAGGGEQEGWEAAEEELILNASHDEGHGDPERDAFGPEREADRSSTVYGEADQLPSSEVVEDPSAGPEDPGAGPGLSADRGAGMAPDEERASGAD